MTENQINAIAIGVLLFIAWAACYLFRTNRKIKDL
jgi:hypothetical protein